MLAFSTAEKATYAFLNDAGTHVIYRNLNEAPSRCALLTCGRARHPAGQRAERCGARGLRATVRLYDCAAVPETVPAKAEREATSIQRQAGVELLWEVCGSNAGHARNSCGTEPGALRLSILSLGILTPSMELLPRTSAGLPQKNMVPGVAVGERAYVFFQKLVEICDDGKYPQAVVLGHLMAHEVGHILLGENSHSPDGLMSGRLSPADLRLALDSLLFFNSRQAAGMRGRLAKSLTARR